MGVEGKRFRPTVCTINVIAIWVLSQLCLLLGRIDQDIYDANIGLTVLCMFTW